ncbi:MAG: flippase-like domain-containing protein [Anaerolineaceae bacterium]|nr:flippase-like domain-containing protein [Anaerolineaceae bacterium]
MSETGFFRKNLIKWVPGVLISLIAILFMIFALDWTGFSTALKSVRLVPMILLFFLAVLSVFLRGIAWHFLLRREASIVDSFLIENVGYLLNNFLPLRMGEVGRAILMGQKTGKGFFETLSTIVIERFFDICFAGITLLIALLFLIDTDFGTSTLFITLGIVVVGLSVSFWAAKNKIKIEKTLVQFQENKPFIAKVTPIVVSLLDGLKVMLEPKRFLSFVAMMILTWLTYWISYFVIIRQFIPDAPFWWALLVDGVVALGIAIPSAPGSLGVWEASFVGALAVVDVAQSQALTGAILLHLINYLSSGIFGVIGLIRYGRSFSGLFSEIQLRKNQSVN